MLVQKTVLNLTPSKNCPLLRVTFIIVALSSMKEWLKKKSTPVWNTKGQKENFCTYALILFVHYMLMFKTVGVFFGLKCYIFLSVLVARFPFAKQWLNKTLVQLFIIFNKERAGKCLQVALHQLRKKKDEHLGFYLWVVIKIVSQF